MAKAKGFEEIDIAAFPHNTVTRFAKTLCLSCVADTFTKLLGMAPRTALQEMKSYTPSAAELTSHSATRPYFEPAEPDARCPYCEAASTRHARLLAYRIEGGKATDGPRRKLIGSLPEGEFAVIEEKSTQDEAFVDWLTRMAQLDQADEEWLRKITQAYLERKLPKENWQEVLSGVWTARRSVRLEEGWEVDNRRLFLSTPLYAEAMVVQYLVSRSQHGGGLTIEGRLTLPELVLRLRHMGFLRAHGISAHSPGDVLEALMHLLAGDGGVKLYYVVDRRDFLEKLSAIKPAPPPAKKAVKKAAKKKAVVKKAVVKKAVAKKAVAKKKAVKKTALKKAKRK